MNDELRRTPGVGDASLFGATDYSTRIWLRPDKLAQYSLNRATWQQPFAELAGIGEGPCVVTE